jgi:hypothetical protein
MAVAYSRYKFLTVSFTKRPRDGRFTPETATWMDPEVVKKIRWNF